MSEWLGALATFPEDGCLISHTHMGFTTDYNSTPRDSDGLFWQIYKQTIKNKRRIMDFLVGSYSGSSHEAEMDA